MALNVGQDFKKRWLDAPEAVRQTMLEELNRICDLLSPEGDVHVWLEHDHRAMQLAQMKVEQAYADLKAELIEAARIRKQRALERALAEKRAQQQAYTQQLLQNEIDQFHAQQAALEHIAIQVTAQSLEYSTRYKKNPPLGTGHAVPRAFHNEVEELRLRLELEAENFIGDQIQAFQQRLNAAAAEEIDYIINARLNSDHPSAER
ncbi:cell division protein BlhA [Acinetobacter larvae]|uniref:ATPase n=1 Tax=Acinetobacter larvae TaxID=1789224 RepID=A0A1B2M372_9GAMM|nr:hypothetical protein BFG52_15565 [Acinetobacter larvae]